MADHSKIEWTDATWNPVTGCSVVSPGCTNCYAMKMAGRLEAMGTLPQYAGTTRKTKAGAIWTGKLALAPEAILLAPLRRRRPTTSFVNSMGDLFHEDVPDEWIDRVFAVMALCPQHSFQVLTKRSARIRAFMDKASGRIADATITLRRHPLAAARGMGSSAVVPVPHVRPGAPWWPLPNVWLGVSAEDQKRADERIPDLLATPAAIRFVSAEPLLGPIDFTEIMHAPGHALHALWGLKAATDGTASYGAKLDWIIVGGESGQGARPMHPDWARQIRDQCEAAGTAFFFKQWGIWYPQIDRDRDDPDWRLDYGQRFADRGAHQWLNLAGGRGFHGERFHVMARIGKQAAGRRLDGVEHSAMPRAA